MRRIVLTGIGLYTLVGAGGCESHCAIVVMSERFGSIIGVAVSAMTGVGGEACALAGGSGDALLVAVTERLNLVLFEGCRAAYGTLLSVGKTAICAGRCFTLYGLLVVTKRGNNRLICKHYVTQGALFACGKTAIGTSSCFTLQLNLVVSESRGSVRYVTVLTYGAGIGGITSVLTVGCGNLCAVAMSLGAIGNCKVLGGIVSALDGGVVLNLHVLSVL